MKKKKADKGVSPSWLQLAQCERSHPEGVTIFVSESHGEEVENGEEVGVGFSSVAAQQ